MSYPVVDPDECRGKTIELLLVESPTQVTIMFSGSRQGYDLLVSDLSILDGATINRVCVTCRGYNAWFKCSGERKLAGVMTAVGAKANVGELMLDIANVPRRSVVFERWLCSTLIPARFTYALCGHFRLTLETCHRFRGFLKREIVFPHAVLRWNEQKFMITTDVDSITEFMRFIADWDHMITIRCMGTQVVLRAACQMATMAQLIGQLCRGPYWRVMNWNDVQEQLPLSKRKILVSIAPKKAGLVACRIQSYPVTPTAWASLKSFIRATLTGNHPFEHACLI
ncbi:unnamed protein product, partial [Mesorhabditis spiculigera]